ncbi:polysaccharide pyruvyl transferase family protein [Frankia sp. Cpl3]|uniref:Polysaccharide pyruvyl transferase domain-containing protein n=1 Tax=Parafrankia colletiae TaxID=573497 RepID=A0A1S1Q733_9ACTN|nr:polysaccharide pyruvyl transferase family protein [Frankia sp. Cpl3]
MLLLGYLGAENTGSEIRLLTIIEDVRAVFGSDVEITVGTASRANTLRLITESATLSIVEIPYVYPAAVRRLTARHDLVMLVEGSLFKDSWSSALLYLFLWGAWTARRAGAATVAYAVDAGRMKPVNRLLTRHVARSMDLIVVRTAAARDTLREAGVTRSVLDTTDTAFQYRHSAPRPAGRAPRVGLAPVNFHVWPVRARPWGSRELRYHWPYYYSWDAERARRTQELVAAWSDLLVHVVRDRGWEVQLVAMEALDTRICRQILDTLPPEVLDRTHASFAGQRTARQMVADLRGLDYLVTSRYHACVLSMETSVPQMALHHDERLASIYGELGMSDLAIGHDNPHLAAALRAGFDRLVATGAERRSRLAERLASYYLPRCAGNRDILRAWAHDAGWATAAAPQPQPQPQPSPTPPRQPVSATSLARAAE